MGIRRKQKQTPYEKGRNAEYYVKKKLEGMGFVVVRSAGSKSGGVDLVAVDARRVFFVEVKAYRLTPYKQRQIAADLWKAIGDSLARPLIAHKDGGKWEFIEFK